VGSRDGVDSTTEGEKGDGETVWVKVNRIGSERVRRKEKEGKDGERATHE